MKNSWSDELTEMSRKTLEDMLDGGFPGPKCILKKRKDDGRIYGYIENDPSYMTRKTDDPIVIHNMDGDDQWEYTSVNAIIYDGWAVD